MLPDVRLAVKFSSMNYVRFQRQHISLSSLREGFNCPDCPPPLATPLNVLNTGLRHTGNTFSDVNNWALEIVSIEQLAWGMANVQLSKLLLPGMSVPLQRQKPWTTWTRYNRLDKNKNNHFTRAFYYLFYTFNNLLSIHIHTWGKIWGLRPPSPWWAPPPYESDTETYDHTSQNWSFRYSKLNAT